MGVPLHHPTSQLLQLHHLMCLLCTLAQFRNQNHAQSLFMNQSQSRSTNHILRLIQSPLMCPTRNLNHTTLHLMLRHLPHLSLNLFLKFITPSLSQFIIHLILSPLLLTIHPTLNLTPSPLLSTIQPTLNPNPSIINHIPNLLQNLIIPLSLSIMLHSPSTTHPSLSHTTPPHPSRSHTTLHTNLILTLSQSITIITATMHNPTLHHLRTEHLHQLLNLHQRSQQLLRQLQLQQPQILLLAILLLDNCMQI